MKDFLADLTSPTRVLTIIIAAVAAHLAVIMVRRIGKRLMAASSSSSFSKASTIISLSTSTVIFVLYFGALGFVLKELGISLKAYVASASVIGLAIGFGLQGLVQDVVTGLSLVFSDLIDVGDMVEISSQTGIVRKIGMRFTVLENPLGAEVFIPNRSITNVTNYPRGYIRGLVDITLTADADKAKQMEEQITAIVSSTQEQFAGIFLTPPSMEGRMKTTSGKEFLRIKFRIWPGRGSPIETSFKQEIVDALKKIEPTYADWMVAVNYEVEKRDTAFRPGNLAKRKGGR